MATVRKDGAQFQPASDQSLFLRFGHEITIDAHQRVRKMLRLLESEPIGGIRNLTPAYCSLLLSFDTLKLTHGELEAILCGYLGRLDEVRLPEPRRFEIPVVYGGEFGPDLQEVAFHCGLTPVQAMELHLSATYIVYFLGFVPGFAYLGELPAALSIPRLSTPRRSVHPGSVGIAGKQTGIYPFAVPGGWRIIGRTPTQMFGGGQNNISLLSIGDLVRFTSISKAQFIARENA